VQARKFENDRVFVRWSDRQEIVGHPRLLIHFGDYALRLPLTLFQKEFEDYAHQVG